MMQRHVLFHTPPQRYLRACKLLSSLSLSRSGGLVAAGHAKRPALVAFLCITLWISESSLLSVSPIT
jgi:hypothetical protein